MLKHVAPIAPTASIPDPDHRDFLPPEGRTVPWTPHWAGLGARREIVVSDPPVPVEAEAPTEPETHAPEVEPSA